MRPLPEPLPEPLLELPVEALGWHTWNCSGKTCCYLTLAYD